jgi:hypothetical protein
MPCRAVEIPEQHRTGLVSIVLDADLRDALPDGVIANAGQCEAGDVSLDVSDEHRHAEPREALCQHEQRHRLARAGGAGYEPVAVTVPGEQMNGLLALPDEYPIHA